MVLLSQQQLQQQPSMAANSPIAPAPLQSVSRQALQQQLQNNSAAAPMNSGPNMNNLQPGNQIPSNTPAAGNVQPAASVQQQAIGGGNNPQQVQNFLQALKQSGAGTNNNQMNSAPPAGYATNANQASLGSNYGLSQQANPNQYFQPQQNQGYNTQNFLSALNQGNSSLTPSSQNTIAGTPYAGNPGNYTGSGFQFNTPITRPPYITNANSTNPGTAGGSYSTYQPAHPNLLEGSNTNTTGVNNYAANRTTPANQPSFSGNFQIPQVTMSDQTKKENIEPGDSETRKFIEAIKGYKYNYKDKQDGPGTYVSPMAQDLEKTEIGKSAVEETPRGKMVNYGRLVGVSLAASAMLNEDNKKLKTRVERLERALSKGN